MDVYQLKIALRGISPMVWRRLIIAGNTDLGDLHIILQLAMGWKDYHLHAFHIYGKDYGTYKPGGMMFENDPKTIFLSDFRFRIGDRFVYDYDFTAGWLHDIRIEAIETTDAKVIDPVCTGGHGFCPPEDLESPLVFKELLHTLKNPFDAQFLSSCKWLIESGVGLKFSRRQVNRQLKDKAAWLELGTEVIYL